MRFLMPMALALVGLSASASAETTFNRQAWLDDFVAIQRGMAQYYANLDNRLLATRVNPAKLDKAIRDQLAVASSDLEAYAAIRDFIEFFDDPHLRIELGKREAAAAESGRVVTAPVAAADCTGAGYRPATRGVMPAIAALPGWRTLGDTPFAHGVVGDLGVVRIPSFQESRYAEACTRVFRPGIGDRELQIATRAELQRELTAALAALRAAGARRLLIDLTGNGGGSEWDREAAALFTDRALRRTAPRLTGAPCDRSAIWRAEVPACAVFTGPTETVTLEGTGAWTDPVTILADRRTASAAEEFIGWLVDNKVSTLIGEATAGAGCGYVDGGQPVALGAVPGHVAMPNCARFAADGTNEIEGWVPAIRLRLPAPGGEAEWGKALLRALGS